MHKSLNSQIKSSGRGSDAQIFFNSICFDAKLQKSNLAENVYFSVIGVENIKNELYFSHIFMILDCTANILVVIILLSHVSVPDVLHQKDVNTARKLFVHFFIDLLS